MAVTRLERKGRKNKNVAKNRVATIQRLSFVPVIKNVDVDAIKKEFDAKKAKPAVKVEKVGKTAAVKLKRMPRQRSRQKRRHRKQKNLQNNYF